MNNHFQPKGPNKSRYNWHVEDGTARQRAVPFQIVWGLLKLLFLVAVIVVTAWWLFEPLGWWLVGAIICAPFALLIDYHGR